MSHLSATAVLIFALISISTALPAERRSRKYIQSRDMIVVSCFVQLYKLPLAPHAQQQTFGRLLLFCLLPSGDSARFQDTRRPYLGREMIGRFQSYPWQYFGTTQVG